MPTTFASRACVLTTILKSSTRLAAGHGEASPRRLARRPAAPAWLLGKPVSLIERDHRPFYGSPLRIVSPSERIESGWWGGQLVTRDYFVAEASDHICYWIFSSAWAAAKVTRRGGTCMGSSAERHGPECCDRPAHLCGTALSVQLPLPCQRFATGRRKTQFNRSYVLSWPSYSLS